MKPGGADRAFRAGEAAGAGGARETGARPVLRTDGPQKKTPGMKTGREGDVRRLRDGRRMSSFYGLSLRGKNTVFSARFGPGGAVRPAALRFSLMEEALMIRREAGKQPYLGGRM